jgi:hypothetical protein
MDVITYSLRDGQARSDQYYRDIAAFTDQVLAEAQGRTQPLVESFQSYWETLDGKTPPTEAECTLELLTLGTLWRVYAGDALDLAETPREVLTGLVRLRQRGGRLKQGADLLRGLLSTLFLFPNNGRKPPMPTLDHLDRLLKWLAATGDFDQEAKRLRTWYDFLASRRPEEASRDLATAITLAAWFESCSEATLGRYTPHVDQFLTGTHPSYRWREDAVFCGRRRVEYHLNMVGTEILNRAFRREFANTPRKIVLVPPCMKAQPDDKCRARLTSLGARCAGCTPGCRVHQLTRLGEKHGFGVLILPDDLRVFSASGMSLKSDDKVGIVGISCVLTNASGGWQTKDLGIPAQGVLLDYCGCRYHWHKDGIPTDINFIQLADVLGIGRGKPQAVPVEERENRTSTAMN